MSLNYFAEETAKGGPTPATAVRPDSALRFDRFGFPQYRKSDGELRPNFCELLAHQGEAHGVVIEKSAASVVAQTIGRPDGFDVIFLSGKHSMIKTEESAIVGMLTITKSLTGWGHVMHAEDAVVYPEYRGNGFAKHIFHRALLLAWQEGLNGMVWETARSNTTAHNFFRKLDPSFAVNNLTDVWVLSPKQCRLVAEQQNGLKPAVLAKTSHLNKIADTLGPLLNEARDLGAISQILVKQEQGVLSKTDPFVLVTPDTGSFAIVSLGYSTFDGASRFDVVQGFMQPDNFGNGWRSDQKRLVQAICKATGEYDIAGGVHIQQLHSFNSGNGCFRQKAYAELEEAGAEILTHKNSPMVAYDLTGERYIRAVVDAYTNLCEGDKTSLLSKKRLVALRGAAKMAGIQFAA